MLFQAVVFAGGNGNRMTNLSDHISKSLLPVANIPLFWYSLNLLSRNNITDVILVANESNYSTISEFLKNGSLPILPNLKIDLIKIEDDEDDDVEEWGTADVLRHISSKFNKKSNLLLVSGDIVSDLELKEFLDFHLRNDALLTALVSDSTLNGPIPGVKERPKKYRDFTAFLPDSNQLLFLTEEEDFGDSQEFDEKLFRKYKKILFTSKYKDIHIYAVKSSVIDLIKKDRNLNSVKADVLPQLLMNQKCYIFKTTPQNSSLIAHCNNISAYFEANKAVQKILNNLCPTFSSNFRQDFKQLGVNVSESRISSLKTKLGEKSAIKKSVIGEGCEIGTAVKIENSLLMKGVKVKNGAVIKNSIVFPNVEIGEKADVLMSIVSTEQIVKPKEKIANTVLVAEKEMSFDD